MNYHETCLNTATGTTVGWTIINKRGDLYTTVAGEWRTHAQAKKYAEFMQQEYPGAAPYIVVRVVVDNAALPGRGKIE